MSRHIIRHEPLHTVLDYFNPGRISSPLVLKPCEFESWVKNDRGVVIMCLVNHPQPVYLELVFAEFERSFKRISLFRFHQSSFDTVVKLLHPEKDL